MLSSYYCGSARTGYRRTDEYMGGELTLGTAAAISGAAASPNMGSRTPSMPLVVLLALVNARLGFWAPTPYAARWREPLAALWPFYLLSEALSQTTDLSTYCYLTDGGHFDNTGLYPLVERGCRYIVLLDCGADPGPCFADLGDAIRRCRIDFGAEISLGVQGFLDHAPNNGRAARHVMAGKILYRHEHWDQLGFAAQSDADRTGVIVWVKPAVHDGRRGRRPPVQAGESRLPASDDRRSVVRRGAVRELSQARRAERPRRLLPGHARRAARPPSARRRGREVLLEDLSLPDPAARRRLR